MYVFAKFHILDFIDKLWAGFEEHTSSIVDKNIQEKDEHSKQDAKVKQEKALEAKKVRYDRITAKAFAYYVFLLFFRWAVVFL